MARKKKATGDGNGAAKKAAAASEPNTENAQFGIIAQFVKDLSFESPNAPLSLQKPGDNPRLEVNVQARAIKHAEDIYEVDLQLEARAASDAGVVYNVEVVYGGMFRVVNIPEDYLKPVLFTDAPTIMFPFLRRVVADLIRDGGFQPLMIDPIDFGSLYQQNADKARIETFPPAN